MANNELVNGVIEKILSPVLFVLEWVIEAVFSSQAALIIFFILLVNLIAIILMKKDKGYAERGERRIPEMTLMIVALIGGSLGMYYAMFKYKHKTLHNKFSIGIPVIIVMQVAYVSYFIISGVLS